MTSFPAARFASGPILVEAAFRLVLVQADPIGNPGRSPFVFLTCK